MNPAIVSAIIAARPKPEPSTVNTIIKVAAIGVGGYVAYKWYKKTQENAANADVTKDVSANSAQLLRGYMNPSGVSWMRNFDGTKGVEILIEAKNIADLAAVQKYYRDMFSGADLLEDLRQELNAEDYTKFIATVKSNKVITGKDGKKTVDPNAGVYDLFYLSNRKTFLYSKQNGRYQEKQIVLPYQYLNNGNKNIDISKITEVGMSSQGTFYRTTQKVGNDYKTVYLKKTDWDLVARFTLNKGIAAKKYKSITVDGSKF